MKLQFTETIEREVEITLPCYRKDDMWIVKLIGEHEYIQVRVVDEKDGGDTYFINHNQGKYSTLHSFFRKNYVDATEEEFETALRETKRRLLADVNAQIFQQEKAA